MIQYLFYGQVLAIIVIVKVDVHLLLRRPVIWKSDAVREFVPQPWGLAHPACSRSIAKLTDNAQAQRVTSRHITDK